VAIAESRINKLDEVAACKDIEIDLLRHDTLPGVDKIIQKV
jgi:hypothetical protein